jgi:hypothetical protein
MNTRSKQTTVRFHSSFQLAGIEGLLPEGEYHVVHDEELIEEASRPAWRRVAAFIHLPAIGMRGPVQRMAPIKVQDLEDALEKDRLHA